MAILILSNVANNVNAAEVWPGVSAQVKYSEQEIHVYVSYKTQLSQVQHV